MNYMGRVSRAFDSLRKSTAVPFLIVFLAILFISWINTFPRGYIFAYSDFVQLVNFKGKLKWFTDAYVDYGEGGLNFLYVPLYYVILGSIQNLIGQHFMSAAHSFIFLFGSFCSFYIATMLHGIDSKENKDTMLCFSLLYAVNSYTAIRFAMPSEFFLPYIFAPVLFATAHAYFVESHILHRSLLWCAVAMLASTACWAGPPFFIAYFLLTFAYISFVYLFHREYRLTILVGKLALFYFMFVSSFAMCFSVWPALLLGYKAAVQAGRYRVNNLEWMYSQSLTILDVLTFRTGLFGLVNVSGFSLLVFMLPFLFLFSLFFAGCMFLRKNMHKKTLAIYGLVILLVFFFLNKGRGLPWETPVHALFASNIILCSLRSFDKILIFLPFFLLMFSCLYSVGAKSKIIPRALLIATFLCISPFIVGNLYRNHYAVEPGKDYKTSRYAALVKIPQGYFDAISVISRIKSDVKILSLPWSLGNPDLKGWIISEKWKNCGSNPLVQYFNHPVVQMNEPSSFFGWNYGEHWNEQKKNESLWLIPLSGMLDVKYWVFHKDVAEQFVLKAAPKIAYYKKKGIIKLLDSNPFFDFFEVDDKYVLPHFYIPERLYILEHPEAIPSILNSAFEQGKLAILGAAGRLPLGMRSDHGRVVIEYKKIDAAKYRVRFHGITGSFPFVFSEAFYSYWKIYPTRYIEAHAPSLENYKIFEHNEDRQASAAELKTYLDKGWVSGLGDGCLKRRRLFSWVSSSAAEEYQEEYHADFVSKNIRGTIQNDNLPDGYLYDTWHLMPVDEKFHQIVNGYANYWLMDIEYLRTHYAGAFKMNPDGSSDLEVIIEFWPQKLLNMSRAYVILFAVFVVALLGASFFFRSAAGSPN